MKDIDFIEKQQRTQKEQDRLKILNIYRQFDKGMGAKRRKINRIKNKLAGYARKINWR